MSDLNSVHLIGRLVRDPQMKYLPSQTAVVDFSLAVGRKFKAGSGETKEETSFIDVTIFGKGAETFNQYMAKGSQVQVSGRLHQESWEDKNGGGKRTKLKVIADTFQFLGKPGGQQGGGSQRQQPQRETSQSDDQTPPGLDEDDIPF